MEEAQEESLHLHQTGEGLSGVGQDGGIPKVREGENNLDQFDFYLGDSHCNGPYCVSK